MFTAAEWIADQLAPFGSTSPALELLDTIIPQFSMSLLGTNELNGLSYPTNALNEMLTLAAPETIADLLVALQIRLLGFPPLLLKQNPCTFRGRQTDLQKSIIEPAMLGRKAPSDVNRDSLGTVFQETTLSRMLTYSASDSAYHATCNADSPDPVTSFLVRTNRLKGAIPVTNARLTFRMTDGKLSFEDSSATSQEVVAVITCLLWSMEFHHVTLHILNGILRYASQDLDPTSRSWIMMNPTEADASVAYSQAWLLLIVADIIYDVPLVSDLALFSQVCRDFIKAPTDVTRYLPLNVPDGDKDVFVPTFQAGMAAIAEHTPELSDAELGDVRGRLSQLAGWSEDEASGLMPQAPIAAALMVGWEHTGTFIWQLLFGTDLTVSTFWDDHLVALTLASITIPPDVCGARDDDKYDFSKNLAKHPELAGLATAIDDVRRDAVGLESQYQPDQCVSSATWI